MIRRSPRPETGFVVVRNEVARDSRLSYRARGLLVAILSRPDNWVVNRDRLAAEGSEGRDAIVTALNELVEAGYAARNRFQSSDGCWRTELVVFEQPQTVLAQNDGVSATDFQSPTPGKPTPGKPTPGNPSSIENSKRKTTKKTVSSPDGDGPFTRFWAIYPRKVGREAARKAFNKLTAAGIDPDIIIAGLETQLVELNSREMRYRPHPGTWLNQHRWEDELDSRPATAVELFRTFLEEGN